jgi:hypothetical protein
VKASDDKAIEGITSHGKRRQGMERQCKERKVKA